MSDFLGALNIASSGLAVQQERMAAISSNLANANSTSADPSQVYKKKDVRVEALPQTEEFTETLDKALGPENKLARAQVTEISEDQRAPRMVYNPSHPDANSEGYVAMPNVNYVEEMANLLEASRSYEANISVINALKAQANKALEIGR